MKDLVAAGAKYLQIEDLGAWLPLFTNNKDDYKWIARRGRAVHRRRERQDRLALLLRQRLGQSTCLSANYPQGYQTVLPHFYRPAASISSCWISRIARWPTSTA